MRTPFRLPVSFFRVRGRCDERLRMQARAKRERDSAKPEATGAAIKRMRDFTDTVRDSADIERVVSEYVSLRGAGNSLKGLCPFHTEKTPSFTVSRDKQAFYCFGCKAG